MTVWMLSVGIRRWPESPGAKSVSFVINASICVSHGGLSKGTARVIPVTRMQGPSQFDLNRARVPLALPPSARPGASRRDSRDEPERLALAARNP